MDAIAALIVAVLSQTRPGASPGGGPSRARPVLDPAGAARVRGQAAGLLAGYPLYPGIDLS
jgi:glycine hydroxymethyltransferase